MRVHGLGPVGVVLADGTKIPVPAGKPLGVLAMLTLAGGRPVTVDQLVMGLWGDDAPTTAHKTLQVHVSTLRSKLRTAGIEVRRQAADITWTSAIMFGTSSTSPISSD